MKFVQTFWSCNEPDFTKWGHGWFSPEYHLMSWALSCLQLKRYHGEVTMYTDSFGAKILIDALEIPYTSVICNLDKLGNYNSSLWALPKIQTYSVQDTPFLHVDGDVYIWKEFDKKLLDSNLIAQNLEVIPSYYENSMRLLEKTLTYFPIEILEDRAKRTTVCAYNAGILGGNDLEFFKSYAQKAFQFVNKNDLSNIDVNNFNRFYEQYLFYCLVKNGDKTVNVLIHDIIDDSGYNGYGDFKDVPHNKQFIHLLGGYKSGKWFCEQLANRLRLDHPEQYYRIIAFFKTEKLPLARSYYDLTAHHSSDQFVQWSNLLKQGFQNNTIKVFKEDKKEKLFKPVRYLTVFFEKAESYLKEQPSANIGAVLNDAKVFEQKLTAILKGKFERYSFKYLYARDLWNAQYLPYVFGDKQKLNSRILVADELVEIIESEFDWSNVSALEENYIEQCNTSSSLVYTAIIPECADNAYTLMNLDLFDTVLLKNLKKPITIKRLLAKIEKLFDPTELSESPNELESLVLEKVEKLLMLKAILVIIKRPLN